MVRTVERRERKVTQLSELWAAMSDDLSPEAERLLMRLLKAHAALLAELVAAAERMADDRT